GTRLGVVLHLDRQRGRLDALVFFADLDVERRLWVFFGTHVQESKSYLVPAGRNPRPGVAPGNSIGLEFVAALPNRAVATYLGGISLGGIRVENQEAAIEGLAVHRYRPGDGYPLNATAHQGGQSKGTKNGQRKPSGPNPLRYGHDFSSMSRGGPT